MTITAKEELELQKLGAEAAEATRLARRPWLLQVVAPTLVASVASGAGGYLFGESAAEKHRAAAEQRRAEFRNDVLTRYFGVDNLVAGKRKQLLNYIQTVLAKDDPDLAIWAEKETRIVDARLQMLEAQAEVLKSRLADLKAREAVERNAVMTRVREIEPYLAREPAETEERLQSDLRSIEALLEENP